MQIGSVGGGGFVVTGYFVMSNVGCETKLNNRYFIVPFPGNPNRQVF